MPDPVLGLAALVFLASHLLSPHAFRIQQGVRRLVGSFTGGLAAAYVCLHLIPEIDASSHVLGNRVYIIMMAGFAAYYGAAILGEARMRRSGNTAAYLSLHLGIAAAYSFLLSYTLGEQPPLTFPLMLAFALLMGLHVLNMDFALLEVDAARFVRVGRPVLGLAVLAGFASAMLTELDENFVDLLTAVLAGSMLFRVFHSELPEFHQAHYRSFLLGIGLLLSVHILLGAAQ